MATPDGKKPKEEEDTPRSKRVIQYKLPTEGKYVTCCGLTCLMAVWKILSKLSK